MASGIIVNGRTEEQLQMSVQSNTNYSYCIIKDGIVTINLRFDTKNDVAAGTTLCVIPEKFRPSMESYFLGYQSGTIHQLNLYTNGNIISTQNVVGDRWFSATLTFVR